MTRGEPRELLVEVRALLTAIKKVDDIQWVLRNVEDVEDHIEMLNEAQMHFLNRASRLIWAASSALKDEETTRDRRPVVRLWCSQCEMKTAQRWSGTAYECISCKERKE